MTNSLQVRLIPTSVCRTKRGQIVGQVVGQTDALPPKIVGTETAPLRCPASEKQHRNGAAKKRHQNGTILKKFADNKYYISLIKMK